MSISYNTYHYYYCNFHLLKWKGFRTPYIWQFLNVSLWPFFSDIKLDKLPYQVADKLIEMLDGKKPPIKNWWDVARRIEIPESELYKIKREEEREAGSPTTQLLSYLSAVERVLSLKEFVQFIHSLKRHDICRTIAEFYQNQNSTDWIFVAYPSVCSHSCTTK